MEDVLPWSMAGFEETLGLGERTTLLVVSSSFKKERKKGFE